MATTMLRVYNEDTGGEKPIAEGGASGGKQRTSLDDTADVRDILNNLIGKGASTLADENTRSDYARLQQLLGSQKALKLMTQVFIHNNRSAKVPMEKRIQDFYEVGSNEPEVQEVIKNVKSFGYGVLPGFRESSKLGNQILTGRSSADVTSGADTSSLQEKVMLRLPK